MPLARKRLFFLCLISGFFVLILLFIAYPETARADYNRLSGSDRYQTAVSISQKGWNKAEYVVLANGNELVDALCAGPLAKKNNAPILFTDRDSLNSYTRSEIQRLGATKAIIIGGFNVISANLENDLNSIGIKNTSRIYGADRYGTSVEIAKRLGNKEVALATGVNNADALSVSAVAAAKGYSILLTTPENLPDSVKMHLKTYKIDHTYIIGGTAAISKNIESLVPSPVRLSGANRYETNKVVLEKFSSSLDFNNIYLSGAESRDSFAACLAGAVLAAQTSSPIVLCGDALLGASENFITNKMTAASYIAALGDKAAVPDNVLTGYEQYLNQVARSIYSQKGTYGPSSGTTTITGSLAIEAPDIIIQNTVIQGDLLIGEDIGSGAVELNNVTVKGRTTVRGGVSGRITGNTFISNDLVIDVPSGNNIAIYLKGKSQIKNVQVDSNCILDASDNTSSTTFTTVNILRGNEATLKGKFGSVNVNSAGITIVLDTMATINTLNANAKQTVTGSGTITTANIASDGVTIYPSTGTTNVAAGYEAYVSGRWLIEGKNNAAINNIPIVDLTGIAGNSQVTLYFSPPAGASSVVVQQLPQDEAATTWVNSPVTTLTPSSNSATVTGLTNGTTYLFKLVVTGGGRAGESNVVSLTPHTTP
ncbi:cell wall-binding repeat-containing protein [Dehalobacter sp.]|uniref:cell wall-binding repeat-containing protein n=1 Tax=Dehalobacter sp. TaxID=1962289 RepID=UPI00258A3139|nr:cell wall-binding repeat-containing protein [Dehalobacter sp.]MCG1024852.1 cell wall-binding repeat-containing protein [Dehalobacter sp.]